MSLLLCAALAGGLVCGGRLLLCCHIFALVACFCLLIPSSLVFMSCLCQAPCGALAPGLLVGWLLNAYCLIMP